ncbi:MULTISPECIES: hypothetical protein [Rhodomicrobium]|uniref:hypothetical protein n=1 Tax=Rhodomicrobium TaxID=1068 RepID=UPI000B4A7FBD|nr:MULTISPECIES: hypothetical protein [Rhodomicrobium]
MTLIWLGALLILCGVLFMALQPILGGRFSRLRRVRPARPGNTLEPEQPASGLGFSANWPGLAMLALGAVLLLVGAAS